MSLRKINNIIVLLGAGASHEAGIPISREMIGKLEDLLETDPIWQDYRKLYYFVKSAILFADGISGKFNNEVNYNIERLVNTLSELDRKIEHPLYPFIGNWNIKLTELGGEDFTKIQQLKQLILKELQNDWVLLSDYHNSDYYRGLYDFAIDYQYPLRVFSLNYDLCLEKNRRSHSVERGFGDGRSWDWKNFEPAEGEEPNVFLYKLHGSIDWLRDSSKSLTYSDEAAKIKPDQLEIIFGTDYKLQYTEPFLYFAYQFRQWSLEAKLIVTIGYGFGDDHINAILGHTLSRVDSNERKLLVVAPLFDASEEDARNRLAKTLGIDKREQIIIENKKAGDFMLQGMTIEKLNAHFPEGDDIFEEVVQTE